MLISSITCNVNPEEMTPCVQISGARSWIRIASRDYVFRKDSMTVYWQRPAAGPQQQRSLYKHTKNMYICTTDRYTANECIELNSSVAAREQLFSPHATVSRSNPKVSSFL